MQRPAHILVVDDTDNVRTTLVHLLASLGYVTRGATDGAAGLASIREAPPDLVLCDLRMPVMDGVEFLEAASVEFPLLPVVVMSGAGLVNDAVGALKAGAWDYLTKPIVGAEVLTHAIEAALERAALREENARHREQLEATNKALRASLALLAEDEAAGRRLQFRLLPANHQRFGDYEFSREMVPSAFLSGDFVDAYRIDDRRWGFYIADVAGHGVSSALVTVLLRGLVHREVEAHAHSGGELILHPGQLLAHVNTLVSKEALDKHLTMFVGVVDSALGTLTYANAGHFPFPLVFDGSSTVALEKPGIPIGMMPATTYGEHVLALPDALVLAAFSDGLLEVLPEGGLDAKLAHLRRIFGRLDVTVESARAELKLDQHPAPPDDVAILLIKKGGLDGHDPASGQLRPA